jgi:hypothetical protein
MSGYGGYADARALKSSLISLFVKTLFQFHKLNYQEKFQPSGGRRTIADPRLKSCGSEVVSLSLSLPTTAAATATAAAAAAPTINTIAIQ